MSVPQEPAAGKPALLPEVAEPGNKPLKELAGLLQGALFMLSNIRADADGTDENPGPGYVRITQRELAAKQSTDARNIRRWGERLYIRGLLAWRKVGRANIYRPLADPQSNYLPRPIRNRKIAALFASAEAGRDSGHPCPPFGAKGGQESGHPCPPSGSTESGHPCPPSLQGDVYEQSNDDDSNTLRELLALGMNRKIAEEYLAKDPGLVSATLAGTRDLPGIRNLPAFLHAIWRDPDAYGYAKVDGIWQSAAKPERSKRRGWTNHRIR